MKNFFTTILIISIAMFANATIPKKTIGEVRNITGRAEIQKAGKLKWHSVKSCHPSPGRYSNNSWYYVSTTKACSF